MKCPVCKKQKATYDPYWGYLPCEECRKRQSKLLKAGKIPEFTSETIKDSRKQFKDDIEQPHRKGQLNKRWLEIHGKDKAKNMGFTDKEIKNAKYVYDRDDTYYSSGDR